MSFWSTTSTTIGNDVVYINNTYKDKNGNNKLSTITSSNPGGYTFVDRNSTDPIVKNLAFSIQNDGKITYIESGSNRQYNSIQEFRDAKGLFSGYTDNTTKLIKNAMQKNLTASVNAYNSSNPTDLVGPSKAPDTGKPDTGPEPLPNPSKITDPNIVSKGTRRDYADYYYPNNIRGNRQDFIQFIAYEYVGRDLNIGNSSSSAIDPNLGFNSRNFGNPLGSVTLPIQPSVSDTNSVQWGGEELNSLQAYAASVSYNAMSDIAGTGEKVLKDLDKIFKNTDNNNVSNAVRLFLAGKAVGVNGLLSRMGGAVINPNLELLFQGPQLRPFNFTFRLSPRDETEAQQVKYIIRYFKQNMSVKNTEFNLFLKAPNVFKIKYHLAGSDKDHPSLNRFKMCALQSCSVDYTPDGSYMTFNDSTATMTSYSLTLQFQELEPVTEKDYNDLNDPTAIGY